MMDLANLFEALRTVLLFAVVVAVAIVAPAAAQEFLLLDGLTRNCQMLWIGP